MRVILIFLCSRPQILTIAVVGRRIAEHRFMLLMMASLRKLLDLMKIQIVAGAELQYNLKTGAFRLSTCIWMKNLISKSGMKSRKVNLIGKIGGSGFGKEKHHVAHL